MKTVEIARLEITKVSDIDDTYRWCNDDYKKKIGGQESIFKAVEKNLMCGVNKNNISFEVFVDLNKQDSLITICLIMRYQDSHDIYINSIVEESKKLIIDAINAVSEMKNLDVDRVKIEGTSTEEMKIGIDTVFVPDRVARLANDIRRNVKDNNDETYIIGDNQFKVNINKSIGLKVEDDIEVVFKGIILGVNERCLTLEFRTDDMKLKEFNYDSELRDVLIEAQLKRTLLDLTSKVIYIFKNGNKKEQGGKVINAKENSDCIQLSL